MPGDHDIPQQQTDPSEGQVQAVDRSDRAEEQSRRRFLRTAVIASAATAAATGITLAPHMAATSFAQQHVSGGSSADLAVLKDVSNHTPNVGDTITFVVTLTNNGPDTATNVTVLDKLPAGLTFVSATPSQGSYNAGTGIWTVGSLAKGSAVTLSVKATVVSPNTLINTATVSHSDQSDPNTANNAATVTIVPQQADLAVTKMGPASVVSGSKIDYTITLTNNGPDTATNVTVSDLLPAGLTFVSATPSQGSYDAGTGIWTVGSLANGSAVTLTITATVTESGGNTLSNTATVSHSDQFDPNTANNASTASTNVVLPPA